MPLQRSGNAGTGQAPEVGHENDAPGNPSPMSLNYYTYKDVPYACGHCGWRGKGSELEQGEMFDALFELNCPACHEKVTFVSYPTLAESRANWDKLPEVDRMQVEIIERRLDLFERVSLKSPEQLPEIDHGEFVLLWDFAEIPQAGATTLIRLGDRRIFAEPAFYEGYDRFMAVAEILKAKYGNALKDLVPTDESRMYLYGDRLSSPGQIERFRHKLFGQ